MITCFLTPNVVKYATGGNKSVILFYSKALIALEENYKEYINLLLISFSFRSDMTSVPGGIEEPLIEFEVRLLPVKPLRQSPAFPWNFHWLLSDRPCPPLCDSFAGLSCQARSSTSKKSGCFISLFRPPEPEKQNHREFFKTKRFLEPSIFKEPPYYLSIK